MSEARPSFERRHTGQPNGGVATSGTALPGTGPAPALDPWAHRAQHMRCASCMWFVLKEGGPKLGRCRRHAPTLAGYPAVFDTDWCGDHKLDEARV